MCSFRRNSVKTMLTVYFSTSALILLANDTLRAESEFSDEPAAHRRFDQMIETLRSADSLSYDCRHTWKIDEQLITDVNYHVWLKKPNYFRVEVKTVPEGETCFVLIGDGENSWMYWPLGRPRWSLVPESDEEYANSRFNSYRKQSAPAGDYSIGHSLEFASENCMAIPAVNPSLFHVRESPLWEFLDGVRALETTKVGAEKCEVIEVSMFDGQRTSTLWLSQSDNLPRKTKQIVRVRRESVLVEEWSSVALNEEIPNSKFEWDPPSDWTEWVRPDSEARLLKPGTEAPPFELVSAEGGTIKLSDYDGEVLWIYFWRVGCPPCRDSMVHMQKLYSQNKDQGLVILGFNSADDKDVALEFISEKGLTFPSIVDPSDEADGINAYDYGCNGVPVNYIVDQEGKVVDAWSGYYEGHERALKALKETGLELEVPTPATKHSQ